LASRNPITDSYSSYIVDPEWQRRFSIIWPSVLGIFVLYSLPHLLRSIKRGRTPTLGISEGFASHGDETNGDQQNRPSQAYHARSFLTNVGLWIQKAAAISYLTIPWIDISVGQGAIFGFSSIYLMPVFQRHSSSATLPSLWCALCWTQISSSTQTEQVRLACAISIPFAHSL